MGLKVIVDDVPRSLAPNSMHSMLIKEYNLRKPLMLKGVISYFHVETPYLQKIKNCNHVILTYEVGWIPNSSLLEEQESVSSKDHVQFTLLNLAYQNKII